MVNNHSEDSITLRVGQVCEVEIVSDDSNIYNAYVGFESGMTLGSFTHLWNEPNAGDLASVTEYELPEFYGYLLMAVGSAPPPSAGIHFVFQYEVQEIGETELKLYDQALAADVLCARPRDAVRCVLCTGWWAPHGARDSCRS